MSTFFPQHADFLSARAISLAAAQANRLSSVSSAAASAELWGPGSSGGSLQGDAVRIPYFDFAGAPLTGDDGVDYARFRVVAHPSTPLVAGEKLKRYVSRPSSGARPYIPSGFPALAASGAFVVLTEGEFKAISAVASGIAALAIPGVTMWAAESGGTLSSKTTVHPLILDAVKLSRGVVVLADSDAKSNAHVRQSMQVLADALAVQAGVPSIYTCCPEPDCKPGKKAEKRGLDDWIAQDGGTAVEKYLSWIWGKEMDRQSTLASGGYVPLGYKDGVNFVWSIPRGTLMAVSAGMLTQPGHLMNMAGGMDWCIAAHPKFTKTEGLTCDWQSMGGQVVAACTQAGPFDPFAARGTGVWDSGDGALVVNGSDILWRTDGKPQDRFGNEFVYPRGAKLGVCADTPQATVADGESLLEAIGTWQWARESDPFLMLGWIGHAYLSGAAPWRAHVSLTGARGTGKSFLQDLTGRLLGRTAMQCDGDSTPAGIRQKVGNDALALIIDEAEADGKKVAEILGFLRSASSGAEVLRGTQDQTGTSFQLRVSGMVAGIVPPVLNAADQSRFIRLELAGVNADAAATPHPLVSDHEAAEALGLKLFARMLSSWSRLKNAKKVLRKHLGGDPRYADTIAPVLASAWCILFDDELTDIEAKTFVGEMKLDAERDRVVDAKDESDAFDHLLSKAMKVQIDGKTLELTGADAIARALDEAVNRQKGGYTKALGLYGLKAIKDGAHGTLQIAHLSPQLKQLYMGTKWEAGDLAAVFKRLPGAGVASSTSSIGGRSVRPMCVPLPALESGLAPRVTTAADLE